MHVDVTVMEFTASVLCGVAVGAIIAIAACWLLTDESDGDLIRALAAAVKRLCEEQDKTEKQNKEREKQ